MTPEVAKKLLPLVNTKKNTDALELYMEERVKDAQKTFRAIYGHSYNSHGSGRHT